MVKRKMNRKNPTLRITKSKIKMKNEKNADQMVSDRHTEQIPTDLHKHSAQFNTYKANNEKTDQDGFGNTFI